MDQCTTIGGKDQRLACFDKLVPQVKAALAESVAAQGKQPTVEEQKSWFGFGLDNLFGGSPQPSQQTTPQQFGADNLPAPPPPPPKEGEAPPFEAIGSITANVTDYAFNPFGKFVVFLEGGQVWKQLASDTDRAVFHRGGNTVTISRGMLGSYVLKIGDSVKTFKVKRLK